VNVWSGQLSDPAGAIVNEYSVLSIPAFWRAVRFISETLAGLPKQVFRRDGDARQPIQHPQNRLLSLKPNPFQVSFVLWETWHSHALIYGNGYIAIVRDPRTTAPTAYHLLNPNQVTPFRYQGAQWYLVRGYRDAKGKPTELILPGADVLHLPGLGFDGMVGFPVVWLMYEALELARNSQRFASRYLRRGTQIQGAIEIPGTATKEQIETIIDRLQRSHSGIENSNYGYTVLTGGAKLSNTTIPPEQSQLLQSRQFAVIDICRIIGVPPHVVFDLTRATFQNVEAMQIEVAKFSILPWVQKCEQITTSTLLTTAEQEQGLYVNYSMDALLRGDTKTQVQNVLALVNGGLFTANEGRAMLDRSAHRDPDADKLRIPVNFPVVATDDAPPDKPNTEQPPPNTDGFAMFRPLIEDAIKRVESKTNLAFEKRSKTDKPEFTRWVNVFAEEQAKFIGDALKPISQTVEGATGSGFDIKRIAERYSSAIRARGAGVPHKQLSEIFEASLTPEEVTNDQV
jgi:HK97 family phage portal protein